MKKNRFKKGDIVLCTKFDVGQTFHFGQTMCVIPSVDDSHFNRMAVVSKVGSDYMTETMGVVYEEDDEYEIMFLDTFETLAWVSGDDLHMVMPAK